MKNDSQSFIVRHQSGVSFIGEDATLLVSVYALISALRFTHNTGMLVTRGATKTYLIERASAITHKQYRRNEMLLAADDLEMWASLLRCGLPEVAG